MGRKKGKVRRWKGKWSKTDAAIRGEARVEERNERLENGRAENQDETHFTMRYGETKG